MGCLGAGRGQHSSDVLVIADAKRGDIGNTALKYAQALFTGLGADAVTVAPYMGRDSVEPFTSFTNKWTVLLALTSNPSAEDFEFHGETPLFEDVLSKSQTSEGADRLMYVVGATRPELLGRVRKLVPEAFLLVPGVGAQGGTVEDVCAHGMNTTCGLLVNSSRGILYAVAKKPPWRKPSTPARPQPPNCRRRCAQNWRRPGCSESRLNSTAASAKQGEPATFKSGARCRFHLNVHVSHFPRIYLALSFILGVVVVGSVGFVLIEGYSWVEALT